PTASSVSVAVQGTNLVVTVDGVATIEPLADVSSLSINGGSGLSVDLSGGTIPVPVSYVAATTTGSIAVGAGAGSTYTYDGQSGLQVAGGGVALTAQNIASLAAGGTDDTLFVAGGDDSGTMPTTATLAKLDTGTFSATTVGIVQGWPELTGNGNAELWGFFPDQNNPRVEKIDKTTGNAITTFPLSSLAGQPSAWAFAFWGGDYWVFLMKDFDFATSVYQVDGTTGTIKSTTPTNSRVIVGAGVSTCAPVVIGRQAP
ncbi:MAG: hypothetical protein ACRDL8_23615, partial [Solirubrobacteraceae bacterium]